jgi:hypothetical protein
MLLARSKCGRSGYSGRHGVLGGSAASRLLTLASPSLLEVPLAHLEVSTYLSKKIGMDK